MDSQLLSRKSLAALAVVGFLSVGCGGGGGSVDPQAKGGPLPGAFSIAQAEPRCTPGGPAIRLTWGPSTDALEFLVFRGDVAVSDVLEAPVQAFDDLTGLAPGGQYRYVVRAVNAHGFTDSALRIVNVPGDVCVLHVPPPVPGDFVLAPATPHCTPGGPAVGLAWDASVGATGFEVYRDGVLRAGSLSGDTLSFEDSGDVLPSAQYHYMVRAVNDGGVKNSNDVIVDVPADVCPVAPPPAPGAFAILEAAPHCTPGGPAIRISWTASENATAYEVFRLDVLLPVPIPADTLSLEDADGIVAGGAYTYYVRALNGVGDVVTDKLDVDVPADVCPPLPPVEPPPFMITALTPYSNGAVPAAPAPAVLVQWSPQAGATGYEVFRDEVLVSSLLADDAVEFEDTVGIVEGATHIYFVRAFLPVDSTDTPRLGVHVPVGLVPPPPPPAPASERIVNGSFANGDASWTLTGNFLASTDGLDPRTPPGYAIGGVDSYGVPVDTASGEMHQAVAIPGDASTAMLSFYYRVSSSDASTGAVDTLDVTIDDGTGAHLATVVTLSNLDNAPVGVYSLVTFDLSAFKGQTVRIAFSVATNDVDPTSFQIDDVSVMADGN